MSNNPVVRVKGFQKAAPASDAPAVPAAKAEEPIAPSFKPLPVEASIEKVPVATERRLPIGAQDTILPHYTKDSDPERMIRRQWWKHNLYVKSGRQKDNAPQQEV